MPVTLFISSDLVSVTALNANPDINEARMQRIKIIFFMDI